MWMGLEIESVEKALLMLIGVGPLPKLTFAGSGILGAVGVEDLWVGRQK